MNTRGCRCCIGLIIFITATLCACWIEVAEDLPPLYLTIIVHTEEDMGRGVVPKANIPDYDGNEALMHYFALALRTLSRGAALYEPDF